MRVAVVIPLYRLAQFLTDAVTSVLVQTLCETCIVIVNDGCPDPASHQLGAAFAASHPDRIAYVFQRNRGPSAARNRGIRYAIARWPELEAFFFLDADNMLEAHTLETMYKRLTASKRLGWVYAALERFGAETGAWYPDSPANLYRMLFENQSDVGSLVRREVFEDGIFFDEEQRGYEDWEFFVRVLRKGYEGESIGYCGFHYRVRENSRYRNSKADHAQNVARLQAPHRDLLEPRRLTALENEVCPRFLWKDVCSGQFILFTDPESICPLPLDRTPIKGHWPPILIIGSSEARRLLMDTKIMRGMLLLVQALLPRSPLWFRFECDAQKWEFVEDRVAKAPHICCFYSWKLQDAAGAATATETQRIAADSFFGKRHQIAIHLPSDAKVALPTPLTTDVVHETLLWAHGRDVFALPERPGPNELRQGSLRYFSWSRHCVRLDTTHPIVGTDKVRIGFAVPWLKLGGVDQCVIHLARAIRRLVPRATLHLVTTREGIGCGFERTRAFDEVIFLSSLELEQKTRLCDVVFRSMDLVVNAHSEAAYQSLKWRLDRPRADRTGVHVSYLHVIDEAKGRLTGYPPMAVKLQQGIDAFAVISDSLRSYLINQGVSPGAIRLVRNAPVVRPQSIGAAQDIAETKARRLAAGERPLRLLFAGRADYQKGIARLKHMTELLIARGAPFELRFVGDAHLRAENVVWPTGPIYTHPATYDEVRLAAYYAEADVCVLLSRWEGVPLSLLDAMAHGCVVMATDVGGVSELVEDRRNGFLLTNTSDEDVAAQAALVIGDLLHDETGSAAMRREAVATAWRYSWDESARALLSLLPDAVKTQYGLSEL